MRERIARMSLMGKINVMTTALIIFLCTVVTLLSVIGERRYRNADFTSQSLMLLSSISSSIKTDMEQTEIVINELLGTKSISTFLRTTVREKRIIQLVFRVIPDIQYGQAYLMEFKPLVRVLTSDGLPTLNGEYVLDDRPLRSAQAYQRFLSGSESSAWLFDGEISAILGADTVTFAHKINRGVNNPIGVVACSVPRDRLFSALDYWTGEGVIAVLDQQGSVIWSRGDEECPIPEGIDFGFTRKSGRIFVMTEVAGMGLRVVLAVNENVAYRGVLRRNAMTFAVIFIAFMILWLVVTAIIRQMLRRLNHLTQAVQDMSARDYRVPLPESGSDEVGRLSMAFDHLLTEINDSYSQLIAKEYEKRLATSAALQYQMNPHFLFNSLYVLQLRAEQSGADQKVSEAISLLGKVLRYNLDGSVIASVEEEEEHIRAYTEFLRIVREADMSLEVSIPEELRGHTILRFSLQPVIENSFKHGWIQGKPFHISVRFSCDDMAGLVRVAVENDGRPIPPDQLEDIRERISLSSRGEYGEVRRGVGLANLAQRLRVHYGAAARLEVNSEEGRTWVVLVIPMRPLDLKSEGGAGNANPDR